MNKILGHIGEFILAILLIVLMIFVDYDSFIEGLKKIFHQDVLEE